MPYLRDLSERRFPGAPAFNKFRTEYAVGWLDREHHFDKAPPTEDLLDLIWAYCKVSVAQTRGVHECDLCIPPQSVHAVRHGERLGLGTSEIRVFSKRSIIYAAPTLIYHYVRMHQYKPPDEFLRALRETLGPPAQEYIERLKELDLKWNETSAPPLNLKVFKFERIDGEVRRVDVEPSFFLDES